MQLNVASADTNPRLTGQTEKEEPAKYAKNMPSETGERDIQKPRKNNVKENAK